MTEKTIIVSYHGQQSEKPAEDLNVGHIYTHVEHTEDFDINDESTWSDNTIMTTGIIIKSKPVKDSSMRWYAGINGGKRKSGYRGRNQRTVLWLSGKKEITIDTDKQKVNDYYAAADKAEQDIITKRYIFEVSYDDKDEFKKLLDGKAMWDPQRKHWWTAKTNVDKDHPVFKKFKLKED